MTAGHPMLRLYLILCAYGREIGVGGSVEAWKQGSLTWPHQMEFGRRFRIYFVLHEGKYRTNE